MNTGPTRWTNEVLARSREILGGHISLNEALAEMAGEFGFSIVRQTLEKVYERRGWPSPAKHLLTNAIPNVEHRDTQRMEVAEPVELPDDSGTTIAQDVSPASIPEAPTSAVELAAHRMRGRIEELRASNRRLLDELAAKDDELESFKAIARPPRPIEAPPSINAKQRKGAAVLLCSDWHVEEPVYPDHVNGLNEYNLEIAERCIERLGEGFAWMVADPRFDIRTAIVALLGDLLSGHIHPELVESCLLSPQETLTWLLDRIERMLRLMALMCPNIERWVIVCKSGNHGRATEKQRVSTREANSNEQVLYQTLARVMKDDPRFEFVITPGEWTEIDCMGFPLAFTHGDSFNYGGGVGGVSIPIRRGIARQFQGRKIHQFNMGHFHTRQDFGDIQINGSMIGYSDYSQRIHAAPEPRQQSYYLVDSVYGKCISAPIIL